MDKDRVAGSAKKIKGSIKEVALQGGGRCQARSRRKSRHVEGKVQNAVGGLKDTLKSTASDEVEGNQPAKNVACQRRMAYAWTFLRPGRSAGGISECKPHFANKTCCRAVREGAATVVMSPRRF